MLPASLSSSLILLLASCLHWWGLLERLTSPLWECRVIVVACEGPRVMQRRAAEAPRFLFSCKRWWWGFCGGWLLRTHLLWAPLRAVSVSFRGFLFMLSLSMFDYYLVITRPVASERFHTILTTNIYVQSSVSKPIWWTILHIYTLYLALTNINFFFTWNIKQRTKINLSKDGKTLKQSNIV